jgi:two-component system chemotaxis response regulator CheB
MGEAIATIINTRKLKNNFKIPVDIRREAEIAERLQIGIDAVQGICRHSYSCPECGGGLWEIKKNGLSRYRCHVRHAFTEDGRMTGMGRSTEAALWTALRILDERKNLLRKIANKEKEGGNPRVAATCKSRAEELEEQIQNLKTVLFSTLSD